MIIGRWLSLVTLTLASGTVAAQTPVAPVTATPSPALEVTLGFRDWAPLTLAGPLVLTGNATGKGGVVAVDGATGKPRWLFRPTGLGSSPQLHVPIVVAASRAFAILDMATDDVLVALDLATGKELWRATVAGGVQNRAGLAADAGMVALQTDGGEFVGYDAASGTEAWRVAMAEGMRSECGSVPVVRDGIMYTTAGPRDIKAGNQAPGDRVFAIELKSGAVKWRAKANTQACAEGDVVVTDAAVSVSVEMDRVVYAFDRATGQRRWAREVRAMEEGRERLQPVYGLAAAGQWLVGTTKGALIALGPSDGATAWQVPGSFGERLPRAAVAGDLLYFQGSPASAPAPRDKGTLHALDLRTRTVVWSYTHPVNTAQNWGFDEPLAADRAIWITTSGMLLKLHPPPSNPLAPPGPL